MIQQTESRILTAHLEHKHTYCAMQDTMDTLHIEKKGLLM
jgi:hypothetical protein